MLNCQTCDYLCIRVDDRASQLRKAKKSGGTLREGEVLNAFIGLFIVIPTFIMLDEMSVFTLAE